MKVIRTQKNSKSCIICGMENPAGVKAPFYVLDDDSVASVFSFRKDHQSYPGRTHGGMISAMLDELIGRALWVNEPDSYGVTTSLNVVFRKPVPYDEKIKGRAVIFHNSRIGFTAKGALYDMDNNLLAEASGKYFKLPFEEIAKGNIDRHEEMCYDIPMDIKEIDFPPLINK